MDPGYKAQDATRCEVCETNVAQMYCHSCETNLCPTCIGSHVALNVKIEHQILTLGLHKLSLIFSKCGDHPCQFCHFFCKECDIPVCSRCISSRKHVHHAFLQMSQVFKSKQEIIEKDIQTLEEVVNPKYEKIVKAVESELKNLDEEYGKIIKTISDHGDDWHTKINLIVSKLKAKVDEVYGDQVYTLKKHLSHINNQILAIDDAITENKKTLHSNEVMKTLCCQKKLPKFTKLPPRIQLQSPIFTTGTVTDTDIGQLFGSLQTFPTLTVNETETLSLPGQQSLMQILEEPDLLTTVHTGFQKLCNVASTNSGNIWCSGKEGNIKKFNRSGTCLKTILTTSGMWPADIVWRGNGELLYSDTVSRTINVVKGGPAQKLIKLKSWKPGNLCIRFSGNLLVTMCSEDETQAKIVCYNASLEKQTIQFDDKGKPFFSGNSKIKYLKENKNLDICVADSEAGAVVVVSSEGKLRFRYTGPLSSTHRKPFKPYGIATDSQGHILTSDSDNHCIHIIDQTGMFLCYLGNCNLKNPHALCVDDKYNLCVAEYNTGKIKVIKYMGVQPTK